MLHKECEFAPARPPEPPISVRPFGVGACKSRLPRHLAHWRRQGDPDHGRADL